MTRLRFIFADKDIRTIKSSLEAHKLTLNIVMTSMVSTGNHQLNRASKRAIGFIEALLPRSTPEDPNESQRYENRQTIFLKQRSSSSADPSTINETRTQVTDVLEHNASAESEDKARSEPCLRLIKRRDSRDNNND